MPRFVSDRTESVFAKARGVVIPRGSAALIGLIMAGAAFGACREITSPGVELVPEEVAAVAAAPTVISVTPVNGTIGMATSTRPIIQFSELMDLATITTTTVTLVPSGGSQPVAGTISFHGLNRILIEPTTLLSPGTTYAISVSTAVRNASGVSMASAFSSSFTTVAPPADVAAPTVLSVNPAANAVNVAVNTSVSATFSEALNGATISTSSIALAPAAGGPAVGATVSYSAATNTATLIPAASLAYNTSYRLTISTAVTDVAGNAVAATYNTVFTTVAAPDVTSPSVTAISPANGASAVASSASIVITFSEAMTNASVNTSSFTITPASGGAALPASVSYNPGAATATLIPSAALTFSTVYNVNVTASATDASGNPLTPFASGFTTAAAPVIGAPTVTALAPSNGATGVATSVSPVLTFSETMNLSTINASTLLLAVAGGGASVPGEITFHGNNKVLFDPSITLAEGTTYVVTVTPGAQDIGGTPMAADFTSTFTTVAPVDVTAPTVTSANPIAGASGVSVTTVVTATFSEAMNATTIAAANVTLSLTNGGGLIPAGISFNAASRTVTLTPSSPLSGATSYTLTISTAVRDAAGNALAAAYTSAFTTAAALDVTSPSVISATPANSAANVAVASVITVAFSEAMNAATITGSTFTLTPTAGGAAIPASVAYSTGTTSATLSPTVALANSTSYTVSLTAAASDVAGNPLTAFASVFTTVAAPVVIAPTVMSVVPANGATGAAISVGVVFRFSETMNLSTINTTTVTLIPSGGGPAVAGVVSFHGNNVVLFDPTPLLAVGTTYVFTVGTGVKNAGGTPIAAAFSSTFTTVAPVDNTAPTVTTVSPASGAGSVNVATTVTATFSEAMNASTITGSAVSLAPTAGGSAVAAAVSFDGASNTLTLTPSTALSFGTSYTLTLSIAVKDVAGNSLASSFTSAFTTGAAPDLTAPTVTAVAPTTAATGVAIGSSVTVTFSEAMKSTTVNGSTFTLTPTSGSSPVAASVVYSAAGLSAVLTPSTSLAYSTSYTVSVTGSATDVASNGLVAFSSAFVTAGAPDLTSPTVTAVSPSNSTTNVAISTDVVASFSEPLNAASVTTARFTLTPAAGGAAVAAAISYNAATNTATLNPSADLGYSAAYTVSLTTAITDLAGNALTAFTSSFVTAAAPDVSSPTVIAITPLNNASNVAIASNVVASFSEPISAASITAARFLLTPTAGGAAIAAAVSYDPTANSATLNPNADLAYSTSYAVSLTAAITDIAGNPLTAFGSTFSTPAPPDLTAPTISSVLPANGATGVATNSTVAVTFSEPMNASAITTSSIVLALTAGGSVSGSVSYNPATRVATFTPASALANSTGYSVTVTTAVKDVAGNFLASQFGSSFTTVSAPDVTAPTVASSSPANRATDISTTATIRVTFSEPINPATLTASTFTLNKAMTSSAFLDGTRTYDAATNTAIFTPAVPFTNYESYGATITTGVTDVAGNPIAIQYKTCFTPVAGSGVAAKLDTLHWAGNDACANAHWHVPLKVTGNILTRADDCGLDSINCNIAATSEAGRAVLGGASCGPTPYPLPRLCQVFVQTLNGSVNGTQVSFTLTTDNGLTFTFNGSFAGGGTSAPYLTGTMSGATMQPIGINWERQP